MSLTLTVTDTDRVAAALSRVFPARAGMNRPNSSPCRPWRRVPRLRGVNRWREVFGALRVLEDEWLTVFIEGRER